ncbi:hypothetical protein IGI04_019983 [Brassica rapa subsp. trilocularis]|uniref:Uncharacterized protein n=1 Tax=Brassica rapa subsp. trilocularis TaxID=1813537 RepID=A0ABQ7MHH1_BRACM|nr:hypothetical protein IGI04_019983 [Brassica rapa subsp. trilocularis]
MVKVAGGAVLGLLAVEIAPEGILGSDPCNERSNARVGSREDNNLSAFGVSGPSSAASRMRGNQEEPRRMPVQYTPSSYQVQATSPQQMTYPRMGGSGTHDMMQNLPRIATGEVHSSFQSPHGLTSPPMYTSTAAYMTSLSPFYNHNFQSSGMYLPQYGYSGYPPASGVVPQYMSGYPSHEATTTPSLVDPFHLLHRTLLSCYSTKMKVNDFSNPLF